MIKFRIKLIDTIDENEETKTYCFEKPDDFNWEEGAHTHIAHPGFDEGESVDRSLMRHMSISSLPEENKIAITTRIPGSSSEFKKRLSALKTGDEMVFFKVGSRMELRRENSPVILMSMGVGIATMRPIIKRYLKDNTGVNKLININVDSSGSFVFKDELEGINKQNYESYWLSSRIEFHEKLRKLSYEEAAIYYIVGSDAFLKDTIERLKANKVNVTDIVIDKKEEKKKNFFKGNILIPNTVALKKLVLHNNVIRYFRN